MSQPVSRAARWIGRALVVALLLPAAARATDVTIAVRTDADSIDPHYHVYTPNTAVTRHIFDFADAIGFTRPSDPGSGGILERRGR